MRTLIVAVIAVVLVFEGRTSAQDGAKMLDDAWVKAAKAGDLEGLVALYAPDAVLYPPDMMEARGSAAIRKALADLLASGKITDMNVAGTYHTSGDLSISVGRVTLTMAPKGGGAPVKMEVRGTTVARRIGGKWLIVVDHASVPLPPGPPR
jgi:uncharacterized protein (TIGR02246 family)